MGKIKKESVLGRHGDYPEMPAGRKSDDSLRNREIVVKC